MIFEFYLIHEIVENLLGARRTEHRTFIIASLSYWQETSKSRSRLIHLIRIENNSTFQLLDLHASPSLFPLTHSKAQ